MWSDPKPKVIQPENAYLFYIYRTDITRTEVAPELIDNQKWKTELELQPMFITDM